MENNEKNQENRQGGEKKYNGKPRHYGNSRKGGYHHGRNGKSFGNKKPHSASAADNAEAVDSATKQEEKLSPASEAQESKPATENRENRQGGEHKPRHDRNNRHGNNKKRRPERQEKPEKTEAAVAEKEPNEIPSNTGFIPEPEPERKYMFDYDPEPIPEKEEEKTVEVVGIRFRNGGKVYYFAPGEIEFIKGEHAIVETVRGVEYGEVALGNKMVGESEVVFPLKPVMRKATKEDDERNIENRKLEENAKPIWHEKVAKNGLEMQLIDVEYTHDNAKLCFYFTADGRVDFRELVKDLASVFRTRIELRQIGVRDEAKLFGGLGSCGRPFCCNTFLPDFAQVSIKMAKDQNLSLSSSKISGACGRLMCCLRFEHDTYEREYATFPKVDTIVDTPKGRGVIIESSFLTGKIKVKMNNDQSIKIFGKSELKVLGMIKVREEVSEDLKKLEDK